MSKIAGSYTQAIRAVRMLRFLESGERVHMSVLVERFRVHERTIRRDIKMLRAAGEDVVCRVSTVWHRGKAKAVVVKPEPTKTQLKEDLERIKDRWL